MIVIFHTLASANWFINWTPLNGHTFGTRKSDVIIVREVSSFQWQIKIKKHIMAKSVLDYVNGLFSLAFWIRGFESKHSTDRADQFFFNFFKTDYSDTCTSDLLYIYLSPRSSTSVCLVKHL